MSAFDGRALLIVIAAIGIAVLLYLAEKKGPRP